MKKWKDIIKKAFKYDKDRSVRKLLESWRVKNPTRKVMQQMIDRMLKL